MITRITYPNKEVLFCDKNIDFMFNMFYSVDVSFIKINKNDYYELPKTYIGNLIEIVTNDCIFYIFANNTSDIINNIKRYLEMEIYI